MLKSQKFKVEIIVVFFLIFIAGIIFAAAEDSGDSPGESGVLVLPNQDPNIGVAQPINPAPAENQNTPAPQPCGSLSSEQCMQNSNCEVLIKRKNENRCVDKGTAHEVQSTPPSSTREEEHTQPEQSQPAQTQNPSAVQDAQNLRVVGTELEQFQYIRRRIALGETSVENLPSVERQIYDKYANGVVGGSGGGGGGNGGGEGESSTMECSQFSADDCSNHNGCAVSTSRKNSGRCISG